MKLRGKGLVAFLAVATLFILPAYSQAAEHHFEGSTSLYPDTYCDANLTYDGDLPGSGVISEIETTGCEIPFVFDSTIPYSIQEVDWTADFDVDGSVEIAGDFGAELGVNPFACDMTTTLDGVWDTGGSLAVSGPVTRIGGAFFCDSFLTGPLTLEGAFID